MNVEIGAEAEKEYINGIAVAVKKDTFHNPFAQFQPETLWFQHSLVSLIVTNK
jgi:hypothetical protein